MGQPARRSTIKILDHPCSRARPAAASPTWALTASRSSAPASATSRVTVARRSAPTAPGFTMLNGNKRSITIDSKNPKGMEILDRLIKQCDVLWKTSRPAHSTAWGSPGAHPKTNPRMIVASVKGFGPVRTRLMRTSPNARRRRLDHRLPRGPAAVTGAQIGDPHWPYPPSASSASISAPAPGAARRPAPCRTACSISRVSAARPAAARAWATPGKYGEGRPWAGAAGNDPAVASRWIRRKGWR